MYNRYRGPPCTRHVYKLIFPQNLQRSQRGTLGKHMFFPCLSVDTLKPMDLAFQMT